MPGMGDDGMVMTGGRVTMGDGDGYGDDGLVSG